MVLNLDALKRELNVCLGNDPDGDFYYLSDHKAENCLGFTFHDYGVPRECFDGEKLIQEAIRLLEEDMRKKTEILEILKRHVAGVEALCDSVGPCDCPSEAEASSAERKR